jgi:hypothetical protein
MTHVIDLSGGLGNQLFQLAFARTKSIQCNKKVIVTSMVDKKARKREILPWLQKENPWFELLDLKSDVKVKTIRERSWLHGNQKYNSVSLNFSDDYTLNLPYFIENYRQFAYEFLLAREGFFQGTFASSLYWNVADINGIFQWIMDELLMHLDSPKLPDSFGIAIHARRGDYISNPKTRKFHGYCGTAYFQKAIEVLSDLGFAEQGIIISSDDSLFALELEQIAKKHTERAVVVDSLDPYVSILQLTNSYSFIGSNSTFSFWAAYLTNKNYKVFPSTWFRSQMIHFSYSNLFLDNPILLDIPLES